MKDNSLLGLRIGLITTGSLILTACTPEVRTPEGHSFEAEQQCRADVATPKSSGSVRFDVSGFEHHLGYDLPDYASFGFGEVYSDGRGMPSPEIKAVGDLNNDGLDDLVIDYYETAVPTVILFSNGDGTFEPADVDPKSARRHIRNGSLADFNNDGLLDFVGFTTGDPGERWIAEGYSTQGKRIPRGESDVLLINRGDTFVEKKIPEIRRNDWNHGGDAGDIDGDGFIDILPLSEGGRERTAPIKNETGEAFSVSKFEYSSKISRYLSPDLDVGDYNNDGLLDIAVATTPSPLPQQIEKLGAARVVFGDGDFDFRDNVEISFGSAWLTESEAQRFLNSSSKKAMAGSHMEAGTVNVGMSNIESFDLNFDGKEDILLGQYVTATGLWQSAGFKAYLSGGDCFVDATDALFPNQKTNRILDAETAVNYIHNFHFNDLNGDGLVDIVLQSDGANDAWYQQDRSAAHPYIFINQGGYWLPVSGSDVEVWSNASHMVSGDFDGDGVGDVAYVSRGADGIDVQLRISLSRENTPENQTSLPPNYSPVADQACHFDLSRVDKNGEKLKLATGRVSWINGRASNWNIGWRHPRKDLSYEQGQALNLFASDNQELFGGFETYYLAGEGKLGRIGWADFKKVSTSEPDTLLNGSYLGDLLKLDRTTSNSDFKISYELRLCKLGGSAKFDPFVENDGQLKADMACKDPKFAALMGQKCE